MVSSLSTESAGRIGPWTSLGELRDLYCRDALTVRSLGETTLEEELLYVGRFIAYRGSPESAGEVFGQLSETVLSSFLADYAANYGPGSQRWMLCSLRAFLRFGYRHGCIDRDLSGLVPSVHRRTFSRLPRCLPDECIAALQNGIERDTPAGLRDSAMVWLLATYGVRGVQIRRLRLDDLDWRAGRIHFAAAKGGRAVEQHLTAEAGNRLADYVLGARPDCCCPEVFLTLTAPARALSSSGQLSAILRGRMRQLGLRVPEGVSHGSHGFRHAFATRMTGQVPFKDLVDLMGHRNPSTTLIYSRVNLSELKQAALPWPGGGR